MLLWLLSFVSLVTTVRVIKPLREDEHKLLLSAKNKKPSLLAQLPNALSRSTKARL